MLRDTLEAIADHPVAFLWLVFAICAIAACVFPIIIIRPRERRDD